VRKAWKRLEVAEVRRLWELWKDGQTFEAIGEALGLPNQAVYWMVAQRGGLAPRDRRRSPQVLSLLEREEISRGLVRGDSVRGIARQLARAPSTISREIRRHGDSHSYRAIEADRQAWHRARRPKLRRLVASARLRRVVFGRLRADWSPQQIAAWLVSSYPSESAMQLSHETIYRTLYVQARGALKQELVSHLRRHRGLRRSGGARRSNRQGQMVGGVSIAERPPSVADRAVPGHWEGDLLFGTAQTPIATLVERQSRYVLLVRVTDRDTETVVQALTRRVQQLPRGLMQSLTWDRGAEMANHAAFTIATDVQVYFCDPRSPWQRGSNENTNGLLRQYFPKGADLSTITQRQLDAVAKRLNTRPRQTLGWKTPAAVLAAAVASTG
jgi:transposase, IS30 family